MVSGLRGRVRRFLQKPGTADLSRYRALLPEIAEREQRVAVLTDRELTAAAAEFAAAAAGLTPPADRAAGG